MSSSADRAPRTRAGRTTGLAIALALGLTGCTGPASSGSPATAAEDVGDVRDEVAGLQDQVTRLEDQVAGLEDRVVALEERVGGPEEPAVDGDPDGPGDEGGAPGPETTFFDDPASFLGDRVTVRGDVEQVLAATDVASALRIAGETGEPVVAVSATPPPEVARGDVVEVSGTAVEVDPDTFEADFGVAADALFDRPGTWLTGARGQVAVAAVRVEVISSPSGD